jgi:hypothetical protein
VRASYISCLTDILSKTRSMSIWFLSLFYSPYSGLFNILFLVVAVILNKSKKSYGVLTFPHSQLIFLKCFRYASTQRIIPSFFSHTSALFFFLLFRLRDFFFAFFSLGFFLCSIICCWAEFVLGFLFLELSLLQKNRTSPTVEITNTNSHYHIHRRRYNSIPVRSTDCDQQLSGTYL